MKNMGDLCSLVNGKAYKASDWTDSGLPIIRIQNLNDSTKPFNHWNGGLERQVHIQKGDFLIAWSGTPGTSFGGHIWQGAEGVLNQHIFRVDLLNGNVNKEWLKFCVNIQLLRLIDQAHGGVGLKHVTKGAVQSVQIPLPPLEEQKRIAGILDAADALRAKRREALAKLDDLLQSTFLDMFGDPENKSLISTMLEDGLLKLHKDGNHGSQYPRSNEFEESGIPFLSAKCISEDGNLIHDEVQFLNEQKARTLKIGWIEKGDVLLAHNASVGKTILYNGEFDEALIGTSLTAFRPDNEFIESAYLLGALRSNNFQRQLFANMGQTTRNQVPITAQRRLSFPIPPLDLQRSFAKIVSSVEEQKAKMRKHLEQLDDLFASLQQRAFRGDL